MKQSMIPGRLLALVAATILGIFVHATAVLAQETATADQAIEIVRSGIPHDALFAIDMSGEKGVAVGNFGLMLETTDGGQTWNTLPAKTPLALLGVQFAGEHSVAVGQQGLVLTRSGAGEWQKVESGLTQRLLNVGMNEQGLAIAVGEFGFVARSRDHGATWEATPLDWTAYNEEGYEPHLYDALVTPEGAVMICGEFGLILRSDDGGDTWRAVNRGDESVFALQLATDGSNTGYAVGQEGFVARTADGGLTWTKVEVPSDANLLGVWSGNSEVVAVGIRQLLRSSDDGATFTGTDDLNVVRTWYQGVAAGVSEAKAGEKGFLRQQSVYIVGHRGTISRVVK
jgi:photosystem II stability/assembly factor-like uncharacterized protein